MTRVEQVNKRRRYILFAGAAGTAAALVSGVSYFVLRKSPLDIIEKYSRMHNDPVFSSAKNQRFLADLIGDGNISIEKVKEILEIGEPGSGLLRLMSYSIVRKAQAGNLMSARYKSFLDTAAKLLLDKKIRFEYKTPNSKYWTDIGTHSHYYHDIENRIIIDPRRVLSTPESESELVHEIFHLYQDSTRRREMERLIEAEAYLAEQDYTFHAFPSLIASNQWIKASFEGDNIAVGFNIPREVVASLSNDQSAYENGIKQIREKFLWAKIFILTWKKDEVMLANAKNLIGDAAVLAKRHNIPGLVILRSIYINARKIFLSSKEPIKFKEGKLIYDKRFIAFYAGMQAFVFWVKEKRGKPDALLVLNNGFDAFSSLAKRPEYDLSKLTGKFVEFDGIK